MNAAARLVHQKTLSRSIVYFNVLSKRQLTISLLLLTTIFSGLALIYCTHYQRLLHANYQELLSESNRLKITQAQLLLERGTWLKQSRIQKIAESELGMTMPETQSIIIVKE